jgi:hypothetical protein
MPTHQLAGSTRLMVMALTDDPINTIATLSNNNELYLQMDFIKKKLIMQAKEFCRQLPRDEINNVDTMSNQRLSGKYNILNLY